MSYAVRGSTKEVSAKGGSKRIHVGFEHGVRAVFWIREGGVMNVINYECETIYAKNDCCGLGWGARGTCHSNEEAVSFAVLP